jgi:hypothetical protein
MGQATQVNSQRVLPQHAASWLPRLQEAYPILNIHGQPSGLLLSPQLEERHNGRSCKPLAMATGLTYRCCCCCRCCCPPVPL